MGEQRQFRSYPKNVIHMFSFFLFKNISLFSSAGLGLSLQHVVSWLCHVGSLVVAPKLSSCLRCVGFVALRHVGS